MFSFVAVGIKNTDLIHVRNMLDVSMKYILLKQYITSYKCTEINSKKFSNKKYDESCILNRHMNIAWPRIKLH